MAQFTFNDYNKVINRASGASSSAKIGFFKLAEGNEALIRINCDSVDSLKFATVHAPIYGKKFEGLGSGFTPVSCLNELGSYSDDCPFCKAAAEGHPVVGKAAKKVYVEMLVAYADKVTGGWSAAQPVVWERPAGFATELASKIKGYGNLKETVFKISRTGTGKDTRYTLDFIPLLNKPELVPNDFSAFANFNIAKHSYWNKTAEELETYLSTGAFAEAEKTNAAAAAANAAAEAVYASAASFDAPAAPVAPAPTAPVNPTPYVAPTAPAAPAAPAASAAIPTTGGSKWAF